MSLLPSTSPYQLGQASVRSVMLQVLVALLPAIAAYVWLLGPIILVQIAVASVSAVLGEALMLKARGKPLALFLGDGSALVTAWLVALSFPPLAPWWLVAVGALFAIVVAKQLYGGLGQNPFNPAMIAFAACIVAFPALMSTWPPLPSAYGFFAQLQVVFGLLPQVDAMNGATPLDALKTSLKLGEGTMTVATLLANPEVFGRIAGRGWEWIAAGYLVGGLFMLWRGIIRWQGPLAFIAGMSTIAGLCWALHPDQFADPLFHLFSGGALMGAFFIVTDPVSGCTTPRGQLFFGFAAGILAYLIRVFGGYPDGVAFAVLLLNLCAPLLDRYTQPAVFGWRKAR